jgi:hypothetical protein
MTASMRYRQPWGSNEINRLHNEYELRQMSIMDIAKLHKRGEHAILHRLAKEGLILETWSDVRGWNVNQFHDLKASVASPRVNTVFFSDDNESLEDNDDPNDSDYVYESDEDDEDDISVVDSGADEFNEDSDSDSDYVDDVESVDSDSDYEDDSQTKPKSDNEEYDPYSIKQKAKFMQNIIGALKFFVYAA